MREESGDGTGHYEGEAGAEHLVCFETSLGVNGTERIVLFYEGEQSAERLVCNRAALALASPRLLLCSNVGRPKGEARRDTATLRHGHPAWSTVTVRGSAKIVPTSTTVAAADSSAAAEPIEEASAEVESLSSGRAP